MPANTSLYNEVDGIYTCKYKKPTVPPYIESKVSFIITATSIRNMNGNLDIAGAISYLDIYFTREEVEMIIDIIQELDYKLNKQNKDSV